MTRRKKKQDKELSRAGVLLLAEESSDEDLELSDISPMLASSKKKKKSSKKKFYRLPKPKEETQKEDYEEQEEAPLHSLFEEDGRRISLDARLPSFGNLRSNSFDERDLKEHELPQRHNSMDVVSSAFHGQPVKSNHRWMELRAIKKYNRTRRPLEKFKVKKNKNLKTRFLAAYDPEEEDPRLNEFFSDMDEFYTPSEQKEPFNFRNSFRRIWKFFLRHMNYYRTHLSYFVAMAFLGGFIIWILEGATRDKDPLDFTDSIFMATSALTVTGLTVVDFSKFRMGSQFVIMFLIICGGQVLMTLPLVLLRRYRYRSFITQELASGRSLQMETRTIHGINVKVKPSARKILKERTSVEYRALGKLIFIVLGYWAAINGTAMLIMMIYFYASNYNLAGVSGWWCSMFHTFSAFNNAGFSLYASNLIRFQHNFLVLPICWTLILCGNTAFPVVLRFVVFLIHRWKDRRKPAEIQVYKYILKNPRRCFTHLFPSYETKYLLVILIATNLTEIILFLALDWDSDALIGFSWAQKVLVSVFQSISTRTAGFNVVDLALLHIASWVLYVGLMYLSSYPVTVTLRNSNVSEVWIQGSGETEGRVKKISQRLLLRDFSWIYAAFLGICIIEGQRVQDDPNFTIFKILFEIISAYGTVGLSLGYPGLPFSFSGVLRPGSKWILVGIMLLGRHRGLPESVDRAVQLPPDLTILRTGPQLKQEEEEEV